MLNNIYDKIGNLYEEIIGNIEFDEDEGATNNPNSPIMGFYKDQTSSKEDISGNEDDELLISTGEGGDAGETIVIG